MLGGPIHYVGDRYDADADLATITASMTRDLETDMPGTSVRVVRRVRVGSRSMDVSIIEHPQDLADGATAAAVTTAMTDHVMRYGWDRSSYASDMVQRHFNVVVEIDQAYWGARQRSLLSMGQSAMSPSAFMKAVRAGDAFEEIQGERKGRRYLVKSASSGRFVTDDGMGGQSRMTWHRPDAACLHVSGDRVRIAVGRPKNPDAHHSLIWSRSR